MPSKNQELNREKTANTSSENSFPRVWAIFLLLLILATHRLWFASLFYPAIPLAGSAVPLPTLTLLLPSVFIVGSLLLIIAGKRRELWWLTTGWLVISFFADQHRLQPWAYQSAIYGVVFASMDWPRAKRVLIPLIASVYIYSAAGKFDYQFAHTVGQDFLDSVTSVIGGLPDNISPENRAKLALLFPTVELIAGIGILIPATRKLAGGLVMMMHLGLVAILGPWSLNHSTGVLVWNLALFVQAYMLLVKNLEGTESKPTSPWYVRPMIGIAICLPMAERTGYWDHWLSWALYAPHTSCVDVEIHELEADKLDTRMESLLGDSVDGWRRLSLSEMSLELRAVPVYPQSRYQLGLAIAIAKKHGIDEGIRATLRSVSHRSSGKRSSKLLLGRADLETEMQRRYWLSH